MTGAEKVLDWMLKFYTRNGTPKFSEIISQLEMAIEEELEVKNSVVLGGVIDCECDTDNYSKYETKSGIIIYKCKTCGGCL
jgi:hypothetical protein